LLNYVLRLDPATMISGHLPAVSGPMIRTVVGNLLGALSDERFGLPDREAVEALFAPPVLS
jgi:hypothetical protein